MENSFDKKLQLDINYYHCGFNVPLKELYTTVGWASAYFYDKVGGEHAHNMVKLWLLDTHIIFMNEEA
jgi:hypothetical protein